MDGLDVALNKETYMSATMLQFCTLVRQRSSEHKSAMELLSTRPTLVSPAFSILRQEVDSMVRVIFILSLTSTAEREALSQCHTQRQPMDSDNTQRKAAEDHRQGDG